MPPRDDEHVGRRLRVDVAEGHRVLGRRDEGRRDLPGDDPAEQAGGVARAHPPTIAVSASGRPPTGRRGRPDPRWRSAAPTDRAGRRSHPPRRASRAPRDRCLPRGRRRGERPPPLGAFGSPAALPPPRGGRMPPPRRRPGRRGPESSRGASTGRRARRDCLVAARMTSSHLRHALSPRSPRHWTMLRAACQGMTSSTPSSVAASMAWSSRSPLARAWASTSRGAGSASSRTERTRRSSRPAPTSVTSAVTTRPAPSPTRTRCPTPVRFTVAAWRPSAPPRTSEPPGAAAASVEVSAR